MTTDLPAYCVTEAGRAKFLVEKYSKMTGLQKEDGLDTAVKDVLTALMHFCDVNNLDFNEILTQANVNYRYESRCARCSGKLTAKDSSGAVDNFCAKCLGELGTNFTWYSNRVP